MFPNSQVAKNFEIVSNKTGYVVKYGVCYVINYVN